MGGNQRTEFIVLGRAQRAAVGLMALLAADPNGAGRVLVDRSTKDACIENATFVPYSESADKAKADSPPMGAVGSLLGGISATSIPAGDAPPATERFEVSGFGVRDVLGIQADESI